MTIEWLQKLVVLEMSDYDLYSDWEDDSSNSNDSEKNKSKSVEPKKVLKLYSSRLTEYEREEILKHDKVNQNFKKFLNSS